MNKVFMEFLSFSRASVVMTVIGFTWSVFFYDVLDYPAYIISPIGSIVFYVIRFNVYRVVGKAKFGGKEDGVV